MNRLQHLPKELRLSFEKRSLLKVIAGLSNFDPLSVERVSRSAGVGGADLLDIACDPDLVHLAIKVSGLPVCVSAVEPELFPPAIRAGASFVEIGNFDSFYPKGRFFDAEEVLELTRHTRALLPNVVLSVTVPHILPFDQQAQLALDLVDNGADLIQTEGSAKSKSFSPGSLGLIEKAAPTLAAAHTISETLKQAGYKAPLLCASGLSEVTIPMALSAGASGVGIGSAVNKLDNDLAMLAVVKRLRAAIDEFSLLTELIV